MVKLICTNSRDSEEVGNRKHRDRVDRLEERIVESENALVILEARKETLQVVAENDHDFVRTFTVSPPIDNNDSGTEILTQRTVGNKESFECELVPCHTSIRRCASVDSVYSMWEDVPA